MAGAIVGRKIKWWVYVIISLYRQLDWILNHLGDSPVRMSIRVFSERFKWGGKTQPECGQYHPSHELASQTEKNEEKGPGQLITGIHRSASWLWMGGGQCGCGVLYPQTTSWNKSFLSQVHFCQGLCHSNKKSKAMCGRRSQKWRMRMSWVWG